MEPIITRMDSEDLYKLSMLRVVHENYPYATAKTRLIVRSDKKLGSLRDEVREQIDSWGALRVQDDTINFLNRACPFLGDEFLDWYSGYRLLPKLAEVKTFEDQLMIECNGLWSEIMGFECKDLATISELHTKKMYGLSDEDSWALAEPRLMEKIRVFREFPRLSLAEFGFRRRASGYVQDQAIGLLKKNLGNQFVGTSNIWLANKHNTNPIGTMAHEMLQAHLRLVPNMRLAQKRALHVWLQTFDSNLGIALTDTFTSDAFWKDFGKVLSEAFGGVRHDSGDPIAFGHRAIQHYKEMGIDPMTKTIVFSDGLDEHEAVRIWKEFTGLIKISFGIGTKISNDLGPEFPALSIVQKLVECNGKPVVKLSDVPGKVTGDPCTVECVKTIFQVA